MKKNSNGMKKMITVKMKRITKAAMSIKEVLLQGQSQVPQVETIKSQERIMRWVQAVKALKAHVQ